ncbi:MAG: cytochrome c [Gammaproteobacteria bacterium]
MKIWLSGLAATCFCAAASGADAPTLALGAQVFEKWCMPCHAHGDQFPGTVALGVKYQNKLPGALQDRTDLAPDLVKAVVRTGVSVMPFFRKTEVSDTELDALAAYLAEPKKK